MRILLDECLPQQLRRELEGHEVTTVRSLGWASLKNGELLRRAGPAFDVFLTVDANLEFQQNLQTLEIAVVVLHTVRNSMPGLRPLLPELRRVLSGSLSPGSVVHVGAEPLSPRR